MQSGLIAWENTWFNCQADSDELWQHLNISHSTNSFWKRSESCHYLPAEKVFIALGSKLENVRTSPTLSWMHFHISFLPCPWCSWKKFWQQNKDLVQNKKNRAFRAKHIWAQTSVLLFSGCDTLELVDSLSEVWFAHLLNKIASHSLQHCHSAI